MRFAASIGSIWQAISLLHRSSLRFLQHLATNEGWVVTGKYELDCKTPHLATSLNITLEVDNQASDISKTQQVSARLRSLTTLAADSESRPDYEQNHNSSGTKPSMEGCSVVFLDFLFYIRPPCAARNPPPTN